MTESVFCNVPGCTGYKLSRGVCRNHYWRFKEEGVIKGDTCSEEGCERGVTARGYCRQHYNQKLRSGSLERLEPESKLCPGDDPGDVCWGAVKARGLCSKHYMRARRKK